ncbi:MAG: hypothetical protein ACFB6S_17760 [Geminicoccaceae bacterium]
MQRHRRLGFGWLRPVDVLGFDLKRQAAGRLEPNAILAEDFGGRYRAAFGSGGGCSRLGPGNRQSRAGLEIDRIVGFDLETGNLQ